MPIIDAPACIECGSMRPWPDCNCPFSDDTTSLHVRLPTTPPIADDVKTVEAIRAEAASLKGCLGGCYSTPANPREGYCDECYIAKLKGENGRLEGAVAEAAAILDGGTDYERLHVAGILRAALREGEGA